MNVMTKIFLRALGCAALGTVGIAETAPTYQLTDGQTVGELEMFQECTDCPEMIVLPMEKFAMGAPLEQSAALYLLWNNDPAQDEVLGLPSEGPEHEVVVDIPIAVGRNEVTRAEFLACVTDGGCTHTPDPEILTRQGKRYADDPRHPVMDVSYFDMLEYVTWLNSVVGTHAYRLPTEAEWEYLARGGATTVYGQGDTLTVDQANIGIFYSENGTHFGDPNNRPIPVPVDELEAANAWGVRHAAGNIAELTMSCITERHLGLPTTSAYAAAASETEQCELVVKGGRFGASAEYARPANRGNRSQNRRSRFVGFRILREM
ncbi:formylglycine-generating enzyme family protein [Yoonia sp. I 8.24]|uniref:formylglycine-generating enzyme family protein n=1 Tax=Yoonia sp. I 8.24 TaxID=1537229 RepID=UPI001EDFDCBD|nr:formylglycine-generating enzyme family protein [Yoonia sp. I 8.24]MCG3266744.1 formylglycine-generating enzyme family protein [Yoonia sp. I 8.24]